MNKEQAFSSFVAVPAEGWQGMVEALANLQKTLDKYEKERQAEYLTSDEAKALLGISQKTWQTYRDKGLFPYIQIGRTIWVKKSDLTAMMDRHTIRKNRKEGQR